MIFYRYRYCKEEKQVWCYRFTLNSVSCFETLKNCNSENILVVTHNVNASCIENFILNKKAEIENVKSFKNAEVKRFQF